MNSTDLLLDIDILHHVQPAIALLNRLPIIARRRLLPSSEFLLRDGLAGDAVEQIAPLARQPFEVVGYVLGGEVGGGKSAIGFCLLLLPPYVEEFNYATLVTRLGNL